MRYLPGLTIGLLVILCFGPASAQEGRPLEVPEKSVESLPMISPAEAEEILQDAALLFERGKTDAAIYMLQQLEKRDPTNDEVLLKLGEIAIADRNWAYSINVLRKASFIRPSDIEVRLILIDIYQAYQMPIQGIVVAKEILALDPEHLVGTRRLAALYEEQNMLEDEVEIRQRLLRLVPDEYENLKRLTDIYSEAGDLWEAARIHELIREHHPDKGVDATLLADIYDRLVESFRTLDVLDDHRGNRRARRWMKGRAKRNIRKQTKLFDPFESMLSFRHEESDELREIAVVSEARYTHLDVRFPVDLGVEARVERLQYEGRGDLRGDLSINHVSVRLKASKNWQGERYRLLGSLGVIWDGIEGRLFLRDPNSGLSAADFAFLKDPSFDSYGGVLPVGVLGFSFKPGLYGRYRIRYEHGQVNDLDARLDMLRFHKVALDYSFLTDDLTAFELGFESDAISDDNLKLHALGSAEYVLWGSDAIRDFQSRRKGFLRSPPFHFVLARYTLDYLHHKDASNQYESFDHEVRNQIGIAGQTTVASLCTDRFLRLGLGYSYRIEKNLDDQHAAEMRFFYFDGDSGNEIGFSSKYERSSSDAGSQQNRRLLGITQGFVLMVDAKWRF